ncbi:UNVERIFIED_CONTAM: hypothetical protein GTU68_025943, partial [Idotea baltica]|nr:hypothetical protein [Idotea baltica]
KKVLVIGSGFSALSASCYLAKAGFDTHIFEQNTSIGGRARQFETRGFTFDMGPSWYWMPDVFDRFFQDFGTKVSDHYALQMLDPGFKIFFKDSEMLIPAKSEALQALFESVEPGASKRLVEFLKDGAYKYQVGMQELVYKPGLSLLELADPKILKGLFSLSLFTPFDRFVKKYFQDKRLRQIMEFPVLFLGAAPSETPALYSLMNYAGLQLGTWYPRGGMFEIVKAMSSVATNLGVTIHTESTCESINVEAGKVDSITVNGRKVGADYVVSSADYHHTESQLLPPKFRNYDQSYWSKRTMAPSSLIFYLGINKSIPNLEHHNLFFDEDLDVHTAEIYSTPQWPSSPLFYVCCPSKTDDTVAPPGHENLFILMPLASGLEDTPALRENYFQKMMSRLESRAKCQLHSAIVYHRSFCIHDFEEEYGAFKGNAYGLANTLRQTANLKPSLKNKKLKNLLYTGHLTVPGPGVPPSIISGKLAADQIIKMEGI